MAGHPTTKAGKAGVSAAMLMLVFGWGQSAAAALVDLGKRAVSNVARGTAVGFSRTRIAGGIAADRLKTKFHASRNKFRLRAPNLRTAVVEQRHGTWLILFGLSFTLLWLGAGWVGIANGLWRSLAVGIATPFLVNALFPLKRPR